MKRFSFAAALVLLLLPLTVSAQAGTSGVWDKPHLRRLGEGGVALGGYMDHELLWTKGNKSFDQHRFIPFIHAEVTDRIHVAAEIEFEHGGYVAGSKTTDGEVKLEFAVVDIAFTEALTYRAGLILSPLGRFNLNHDSPVNDLTNRPLVAREIIPTTLAESGMGVFGTLNPTESAQVAYELYAVNGFSGSAASSLRSGRGSHKRDNNDDKALVGRASISPWLGLDIGLSFHRGAYSDSADQHLTIRALDGVWTRGSLELKGELASATVEGSAARDRLGYYAQAGYHFLPGIVPQFPNSILTATLRYDFLDLDVRDETRYTVGLNLRPVEDTAIKLDYETWDQDEANDGILFSVATYF